MRHHKLLFALIGGLFFCNLSAKTLTVAHPVLVDGKIIDNTKHLLLTDVRFRAKSFGYFNYLGDFKATSAPFDVEIFPGTTLSVEVNYIDSDKIYCNLSFSEKDGVITSAASQVAESDIVCKFSGTPGQQGFTLILNNKAS